ncbi:MAG TPA: amidohydrolase [Xanthobacteraceae bacterium]
MSTSADLVLVNAAVTPFRRDNPAADSIAIEGGMIRLVGREGDVVRFAGPATKMIDVGGRRVIPGLNDSHTHLIRGGLNYNMELRWDGVPSLADGLRMLREQARRTPPPQWVRVVGGWSEFQFAERRMPTLAEINTAAPETPVFVLHLYDRALLNRAALRAIGYTKDTPAPPGGEIEHDHNGDPTGLLIARPNALLLYSALAHGPKLPVDDQINSTRHFMRELNRLGITSVIDAGGGFQNYPDDYQVIERLHRDRLMTVRVAYNLFTQKPKDELADFKRWTGMVRPYQGDPMYRHNGAGEMLVFSAADFEDFLQPRPELPAAMEGELEPVVRLLAEQRWPFRLHATYNESITRALDVFEKVNRDIPFDGTRFTIDHAETIDARNIERVKALGGGIAIQHRMAYQGEYFAERYGARAAEATPPIARMLDMEVPVGAGTDATRVASYNPWVALYWLVTGKTIGGLQIYPERNRLDRATALHLWTKGSAWFSAEEDRKGAIRAGEYADLAVLSDDYFSVPAQAIKDITSVLTIVGGSIVHATDDFAKLAPPLPPPSPDWSPVRAYGGFQHAASPSAHARVCACDHGCTVHGHTHHIAASAPIAASDLRAFWGTLGCSCFAF